VEQKVNVNSPIGLIPKLTALRLWELRGVWITAPSVAGLVLLIRALGFLQPLEWMAYDQFVRRRPAPPAEERIVIIGVTESDLEQVQRYPLDDATLAKLLNRVKAQQPRAIGLDFYRNFPVEPGHRDLVAVYNNTPNLRAIEKPRGIADQAAVLPPPELKAKGQTVVNNVVNDGDGKIRRALLYWTPNQADPIPGLGLSMAQLYLEKQGIEAEPAPSNPEHLKLGKGVFVPFESNDGGYVNADAASYQLLLTWRGKAKTIRTVSMMDVLNGKGPDLRDRIVLIGPTAESLKDFFYTPYSDNSITTPEKMPGVEVQAQLASQILDAALVGKSGIHTWNGPQEAAWIFLWAGMGAALGWWVRVPRWSVAGMALASGTIMGIGYGSFITGLWIPVIPPIIALAAAATVLTGYVSNLERQDRATVMNLFGRYVTPSVAEAIWQDREQMMKQGKLRGQKMTVSVLFTDLKNFSTIAERTDPEALMDWLNEYMSAMTQVVLDNNAVVDKFIGDAVMAVFGVPIARTTPEEIQADAQNAVKCGVEMAAALAKLNCKWAAEGRPTLQMRVGIATGTVVTGSLGGKQRMDYTAIGDTVNIAARLESFDKSIEGGICRILVSEATYELAQSELTERHCQAKSIGSVQLKGREQSTPVYQIFYPEPDASSGN
jgi:adenylate cyclase